MYTRPSRSSCRIARSWLLGRGIPFYERRTGRVPLTKEELYLFFRSSENGTSDLLSTRGRVFKRLTVDLDMDPMNQLIEILMSYPDLIRLPIIVDDSKMMVGFNEKEMGLFIPRYWWKAKRNQYYYSRNNPTAALLEKQQLEKRMNKGAGKVIQEQVGNVMLGVAVKDFFKGYFDFKGRSTRTGYFVMIPFYFIYGVVVGFISTLYFSNGSTIVLVATVEVSVMVTVGSFYILFGVPYFALTVRRYRDAELTNAGIWLFILLPFVPALSILGILTY